MQPQPTATLHALATEPSLTSWRQILRRDPCAYCGAPAECVDHIHPTHANGPNDHTNLTAACHPCNRTKGGDTLLTMLSGEGVGHKRNTHHPSTPTTRLPAITAPTPARSVANRRSEWIYNETLHQHVFKQHHGYTPPRRHLPPHLDWTDDQKARLNTTMGNISLNVPADLLARIDQSAQRMGITRTAYILSWLPDTPETHLQQALNNTNRGGDRRPNQRRESHGSVAGSPSRS